MKKNNKMVSLVVMVTIMVLYISPAKSHAASDTAIQLTNVLGNGLSTVINGLFNGRVNSFKDGVRMFLYGSAAGYGFYQAKKMIGKNQITAGIMLAQLSASVTQNVSRGEHPLAYLGYSLGFARIQIATPFAKRARSIIGLDISVREIITLAMSLGNGAKPTFKNGMISFKDAKPREDALGWTRGLFAVTTQGTSEYVYCHEMIHVAQNLQLQAQTYYEPFLKGSDGYDYSGENTKKKLFSFNGFRLDVMGIVGDLSTAVQKYEDQWKEVEANHYTGH
jgi:hypothetical protein